MTFHPYYFIFFFGFGGEVEQSINILTIHFTTKQIRTPDGPDLSDSTDGVNEKILKITYYNISTFFSFITLF